MPGGNGIHVLGRQGTGLHVVCIQPGFCIVILTPSSSFFAALAANPVSRHLIWDSFKQRYDELVKRLEGSFMLTRLVEYSIRLLASQKDYDDVRSFFQGKDTKKYVNGLEQGLDNVRANVFWVNKDRENVKKWLVESQYL